MDYRSELKNLLDEINGNPCPFCGQTHHADIVYKDAVFNHLLSLSFSDDACEQYRDYAKHRAATIVQFGNTVLKDLP